MTTAKIAVGLVVFFVGTVVGCVIEESLVPTITAVPELGFGAGFGLGLALMAISLFPRNGTSPLSTDEPMPIGKERRSRRTGTRFQNLSTGETRITDKYGNVGDY